MAITSDTKSHGATEMPLPKATITLAAKEIADGLTKRSSQ
jgi:hypothetical protein